MSTSVNWADNSMGDTATSRITWFASDGYKRAKLLTRGGTPAPHELERGIAARCGPLWPERYAVHRPHQVPDFFVTEPGHVVRREMAAVGTDQRGSHVDGPCRQQDGSRDFLDRRDCPDQEQTRQHAFVAEALFIGGWFDERQATRNSQNG